MPTGDKSNYTDKQKRMAEHIEAGYEKRGVSPKQSEKREWATVNKVTGGGKKSGSGRGKILLHEIIFKCGNFFPQKQQARLKLLNKRQTMKNKSFFLEAPAIATCVVGCKQSNPADENLTASDTNSPSVTQQFQNAKEVVTNT